MPTKRPQLVNNEIYHIIIRGVGDSLVFKDRNDYYRGIFSIYEFNNTKSISIKDRRKARTHFKKSRGLSSGFSVVVEEDKRKRLVDILAFCFMPNHIHLLLRQRKDNGITDFMRKVGTGYASYFNKKYNRKGHLFQGRFQSVHIKDDKQLRVIFAYIHINPTSIMEPKWKEIGIKNPEQVIKFLEQEYKWSSYPDYIEKKNFPSVTERNFMLKIMGQKQGCKEFVEDWIKYKREIKEFPEFALE